MERKSKDSSRKLQDNVELQLAKISKGWNVEKISLRFEEVYIAISN